MGKLALPLLAAILCTATAFAGGKKKPVLWQTDSLAARAAVARAVYTGKEKDGEKAILSPLLTVTDKKETFSGDVHNYESLAIYAWKDTTKNNGSYVIRDGQRNPYCDSFDAPKLIAMSRNVKALGEAFLVTKDRKYSTRCVSQLKVWFIEDSTRMNPNLNYGQIIPGRRGVKGYTGAISEAYYLLDVMDCITLLDMEGQLDQKTLKGLKKWFREFNQWLCTSESGQLMDKMGNNHSIMYDVLRYRICMLTQGERGKREIVRNFGSRLYGQIMDDGSQPQELKRTRAMEYSIYNLRHIAEFCIMLQYDGENYYQKHRQRIDAAAQFIRRYICDEGSFPYEQTGDWTPLRKYFADVEALISRLQ